MDLRKYIVYGGALACASSLSAVEKPNIIVFLVDDMGLMDTSLPFITDSLGNAFLGKMVHDIAKRLIHTFYQSSKCLGTV